MFESAQYGSIYGSEIDPNYVKKEERGKNAICVLAIGENELKNSEPIGAKIAQVAIENYLRRPSMRQEAIDHILEFANNAVMTAQSPVGKVQCSTGMLLIQGDSYRWAICGQVCIRHYVDGQEKRSSGRSGSIALGVPGEVRADTISEEKFVKGENSFLLCSENVCRVISDAEIEDSLAAAENAAEWLQSLRELFESRCDEVYAIQCVFAPTKRKRKLKRPVVIAVIVVLIAAIIFFALGARRRPGPGGPGNGLGVQSGEPTQPPVPEGMEGMEHPQQPTRPPKPDGQLGEEEWTQPPAPTEPVPGGV